MALLDIFRSNSGVVLDPNASAFFPVSAAKYSEMKFMPPVSDDLEQAYLDAFVLGGRIIYRLVLLAAASLYLFNQLTA